LYIGDNAGECVFDKVLIEEIKKSTIYVVRNTPVINDATYENAVKCHVVANDIGAEEGDIILK